MFVLDDAEAEKLRLRGYTEESVRGVLFVRSLSDEDVVAAARDSGSSGYRQVRAFMERDTNPYWITAECAEEAYLRGLLGEREFDAITA
jgi:hypothetical protein